MLTCKFWYWKKPGGKMEWLQGWQICSNCCISYTWDEFASQTIQCRVPYSGNDTVNLILLPNSKNSPFLTKKCPLFSRQIGGWVPYFEKAAQQSVLNIKRFWVRYSKREYAHNFHRWWREHFLVFCWRYTFINLPWKLRFPWSHLKDS